MEIRSLFEFGTQWMNGSSIKVPCHNQRCPGESGAATHTLPASSLCAKRRAEEPTKQVENTTPPYLALSVCQGVERSELLTFETGRWEKFVILIKSIPWWVVPNGNNCLRESRRSFVSGEECVEEEKEGLAPLMVSKI